MTRETKIGLLVGLAFIIVVGILLQDQMIRSVEPPQAPLSNVADNVRRGSVTPVSNHPPVRNVDTPANVAPGNTIRSRDEIQPPAPPITLVEIRPGVVAPLAGNTNIIPPGGPSNLANNVGAGSSTDPGPVARNGNNATNLHTHNPADPANRTRSPEYPGRSLADLAAAIGEPLVGPDGQPIRSSLPPSRGPTDPAALNPFANRTNPGNSALPPGAMKQYKAEAGDNLNKLALKCYGSSTKALRDLIVKANPSLAADPNKIIIGQTYNIPAAPTTNPTPAPTAGNSTPPAVTPPTPAPVRTPSNEIWYTVKAGDNLTKIAKEQCGDANLVAAIKELNKEKLQGGDRIVIDMKLRLPARAPVASAN